MDLVNRFRSIVVVVLVLGQGAVTCFAEEAFKPMFNGRDLDGWVNVNCAPETWQMSGSIVFCSGFPTGMLRTERMYRNFILEVEWRHLKPKGNAGIFVWTDPLPARGQPFVRGVEVQVLDGMEGDWFTSDGDIFPVHGAKMIPENGRGGDRAFPTEKRVRPSPKWNHYRIHCENGAVSLAVNGKAVTRGHSASPSKGYICLESEGSPAEFRNVRIRELPGGEALSPEDIAQPAEDFRPLYNGLDLRGWKPGSKADSHWKAADWVLEHDGTAESGDGQLSSEELLGDIELLVDWRWGEKDKPGLGGIALRATNQSRLIVTCGGERPGAIVLGDDQDSTRTLSTPQKNLARPAGEWNRYHITFRGDTLQVQLNGETVAEDVTVPDIHDRGRIDLRPSSAPMHFANILVRELD